MEGTIRCEANYIPLSPIGFLERSAHVYSDVPSVVCGDRRFTWSQTFDRCKCLASALVELGISYGHVVATFLPNTLPMYEMHFGVPMAGAILCPLNIRYDSPTIAALLLHSDAKLVFADAQFIDTIEGSLAILLETTTTTTLPLVVVVTDPTVTSPPPPLVLDEYESFLSKGKSESFQVRPPKDELDPISLSFTSGTTSKIPKGVVYSHRGAYLNSIAMVLASQSGLVRPVYLWTVPMFHCNGWCFTWAMAALGGTNICVRAVSPDNIFDIINRHGITHMGGAPSVLGMIVNTPPAASKKPLPGSVSVMVGGAPPPSKVVLDMESLGFRVIHAYGMTETYGAAATTDTAATATANVCCHVFRHVNMEEVDVKDPTTMRSVGSDGQTMGEIMVRGNTVMSGYYKNLEATMKAFKGGWFRTGDIGVKHSDGCVEYKDRGDDIILSGEVHIIATVEVEAALYKHPAVLEVAVVGKPDDSLGETACAFVQLKEGFCVSDVDLIAFCADHLPPYMVPRTLLFDELPKTSTGKTPKFRLRERARALGI